MNDLDQRIAYLKEVEGLSFRQIEAQTGISRKRASKIYFRTLPNGGKQAMQRSLRLEVYRSLIGQWFQECPSLKALQVYQRLRDRGIEVGYTTVVRFTRKHRRKRKRIYHPLTFLPGEEGQVDWFFVNHEVLGKLCGFAMILSYSRYLFVHLFPRSQFEFFIEGHLLAFEAFAGCPHTLVYDNLKSVVLRRQPLQYNAHFLQFAKHYRFNIRLCNPAAGNEKGRVERVIRTLRETFFNTLSATSLKAANQALHLWVKNKNETLHRSTQKRPCDQQSEEKLLPLPAMPWQNVTSRPPVRPTKTGYVVFDTNHYSVPEYLVGTPLAIHALPERIEIFHQNKLVASHPRSFARKKMFLNPLHRSFNKLSSTAKRERIFRAIQALHLSAATFLDQNEGIGEDPYRSAYQIFSLLRQHSRGLLISALEECLAKKTPRLKSFLAIIQVDQQEPADTVDPKQRELLELTYQPRPLDDYHEPS